MASRFAWNFAGTAMPVFNEITLRESAGVGTNGEVGLAVVNHAVCI